MWGSVSSVSRNITTTGSVADDFTGELQEEVIWRGGDTEHVVCHGGQCRDVLRKLAAFRGCFLGAQRHGENSRAIPEVP